MMFTDPCSCFRLPCRYLYYRNWCRPDFQSALAYIEQHPELKSDQALLSSAGGKDVWLITLPEQFESMRVVYKICHGKKPWRYWFDLSLPAREHRNYQVLYRYAVPAAKVLAFGEHWGLGHLRDSYFITEYIPDTKDGCSFMPGGADRENLSLRAEFWRGNMAILATLHQQNFFHKAFHPRNILWRTGKDGKMELFWIDVARCRMAVRAYMKRAIAFDLYTFLRDMRFPREEGEAMLRCYLEHNPECGYSLKSLIAEMSSFRRHYFHRRRNVLDWQ